MHATFVESISIHISYSTCLLTVPQDVRSTCTDFPSELQALRSSLCDKTDELRIHMRVYLAGSIPPQNYLFIFAIIVGLVVVVGLFGLVPGLAVTNALPPA